MDHRSCLRDRATGVAIGVPAVAQIELQHSQRAERHGRGRRRRQAIRSGSARTRSQPWPWLCTRREQPTNTRQRPPARHGRAGSPGPDSTSPTTDDSIVRAARPVMGRPSRIAAHIAQFEHASTPRRAVTSTCSTRSQPEGYFDRSTIGDSSRRSTRGDIRAHRRPPRVQVVAPVCHSAIRDREYPNRYRRPCSGHPTVMTTLPTLFPVSTYRYEPTASKSTS